MKTLGALIVVSCCFAVGLCHATVITQSTQCHVTEFVNGQVYYDADSGPSCNAIGYAVASTSVQFPTAGLAQTPLLFSESLSESAQYPGNAAYPSSSGVQASVDASTSLFAAGPPREIVVEGTITGSAYGCIGGCEPLSYLGLVAVTTSFGTTDFTGAGSFMLATQVTGTGPAVTIDIGETGLVLNVNDPSPRYSFQAQGSQVQLSLQLLEIPTGACFPPCQPTTPVDTYVDQTPEPGTVILLLVPLGLLVAGTRRRRFLF